MHILQKFVIFLAKLILVLINVNVLSLKVNHGYDYRVFIS